MIKKVYNQYSEKIQGKLFFRAKASCSKMLNGEKIFNAVHSVYIHLGMVLVNWASLVCNLY